MSRIKRDAPTRRVTEVGRGDFVKIRGVVREIESNTAHGAVRTPRDWIVRTTDGGSYGMFDVDRYAKAEDLE